jgi:hypothetical protein
MTSTSSTAARKAAINLWPNRFFKSYGTLPAHRADEISRNPRSGLPVRAGRRGNTAGIAPSIGYNSPAPKRVSMSFRRHIGRPITAKKSPSMRLTSSAPYSWMP